MPHQCTNCARTFEDGSKEMLSGCPDCGGTKFQFRPEGADPDSTPETEPPDPPEPAAGASVVETVGKTAATVRDIVGGGSSGDPSVGAAGTDAGAGSTAGESMAGSTGDDPTTGSTSGDPATGSASSDPVVGAESTGETDSLIERPVETPEDTAQASARTDVVGPDELPSSTETETEHRFQPVSTDTDDGSGNEAGSGPNAARDDGGDAEFEGDVAVGQDRPDLEELRAELNDQFECIKVLSPGHYELNLMELYDREEYIIALEEDGRYSIQVPENFRE